MAWLVVDIYIAFLIRTAINAWKTVISLSWPVADGRIVDYRYIHPDIGCDYGEYRYKYSVDGSGCVGVYTDPYFVRRSRSAQISRAVGISVRVGVDPKNPARSVFKSF
jgi:hypothetical protein